MVSKPNNNKGKGNKKNQNKRRADRNNPGYRSQALDIGARLGKKYAPAPKFESFKPNVIADPNNPYRSTETQDLINMTRGFADPNSAGWVGQSSSSMLVALGNLKQIDL